MSTMVIALLLAAKAVSPTPAIERAQPKAGDEFYGVAPGAAAPAPHEPPVSPDDAYAALKRDGAARGVAGAPAFTTQGAEQVVTELVQLVGQIVVERASASALGTVKTRMLALLDCADPAAPFPATCAVIVPLRVEDLATSPDALRVALVEDITRQAAAVVPGDTVDQQLLALTVARALDSAARRNDASAGAGARVAAQGVLRVGLEHMEDQARAGKASAFLELVPRQRAVTLAALAVMRCEAISARGRAPLSSCSVLEELDAMARVQGCSGVLDGAHSIAQGLVEAIDGGESSRRWAGAFDAVFATAGLWDAPKEAAGQPPVCDPTDVPLPEAKKADEARRQARLGLLRRAVMAIWSRDTSALIAAASEALDQAEPRTPAQRRGLVLVAATLQYSDTLVVKDADPKQERERRVKILRTVADELGNREGREGDAIWSFGGSLQALAGARLAHGGNTFLGPVGLPLGFALDRPGKGLGLHLEATVLNLGQYVSFDRTVQVQEPKLQQALAPELTLGVGWGHRTPFFLGLHLGYTPHYQAEAGARRGSFDLGVALGVYVPIVDFN